MRCCALRGKAIQDSRDVLATQALVTGLMQPAAGSVAVTPSAGDSIRHAARLIARNTATASRSWTMMETCSKS
jgi:hypothetical protein